MVLLRPGRLLMAAALSSLVFAMVGTAHAATQVLVGVSSVRFAWTPASGQPSGYVVFRSLNGGPYQPYASTVNPEIEIAAYPNDEISIRVAATGYDSAGVYRSGPQSANSDTVQVLASPAYSVAGTWLLCSAPGCTTLSTRSLANASRTYAQAPGLPAPWNLLGTAKLQYGRDQIIWHNPTTGDFSIYDGQFLAPIPSLANTGAKTLRAVGAADLDGDGSEEFVMQRTDTQAVVVWGIQSGRFRSVGSIPNPSGALLAAVDDFDGNGWVDFVWRDAAAGKYDLWLMNWDATRSLQLGVLLGQTIRLVSGLYAADPAIVSTGDYNGDGHPDLLWRHANGRLVITYLLAGAPAHEASLTPTTGDADRRVVGTVDIGGTAGEEIALQDDLTGLISILDPSVSGATTLTKVVHPGSGWRASAITR